MTPSNRRTRETRGLRALGATALVLAALYACVHAASVPEIVPTRTTTFTAIVLDARGIEDERHQYVLRIGDRRVLATITGSVPPGSTIRIRGRLEPLDEARNPGETSERSIESEHRITARLASAAAIAIVDARPHAIDAWIAYVHARALDLLRTRLAEPGASIVSGELWGERASLSPEMRSEFQETGTVHVLVTAGLHVGLIAWIVLLIAERFTLRRDIACIAAILTVWAFAVFSGGNLPAIRAATMASVALLARACGRAPLSWSSFAISACVAVILIPNSFLLASFWLSFCCVASIFACVPLIDPWHARFAPEPRIREALALALATQLGTWPLTAAMFLQFSPYAVLANLCIVPLVPMTMILGIAQLSFAWFAPVAQAAANLNSWIIAWTVGMVHLLSTMPLAKIVMTPAPLWCLVLYELSIPAAAALAARGAFTPALGSVVFAASLVLYPPHIVDTRLRITVLDVGQADAIVIQTPTHHAIVIDAGGRLERGPQSGDSSAERVGERIVVPFLLREGIHRVDALIISHPHGDHVAGCAPVLRSIRVAEIADGGQTYGGHAYHDCLDTAAADHVPVVQPRAGMVWRTDDGVTLTFIGPSLPFIDGKNAINDNSVAFILQYGAFRMLFTGDAGVEAERRFLDEGIDLHADILKVGHHGSAYSSSPEFIAAVHPRYAIISVGRHNLFGHPARSTIETIECGGATVYRTDLDGGTAIAVDRTSITSISAVYRF